MKQFWLVIMIAATLAATAQTPAPTPERVLAVQVLRALNTAEFNYAHEAGHFGTWDDLRPIIAKWKARDPKRTWGDALQSDSSGDPLPGWKLRVMVAADGQHYTLSLHKDRQCDVNGFSDDTGVIYLGTSLGCETKATP